MRVITCSDCGRPVSDTERLCPYCGCPVNISINKMLKDKQNQAVNSDNRVKNISSDSAYRKSNTDSERNTSASRSSRQRTVSQHSGSTTIMQRPASSNSSRQARQQKRKAAKRRRLIRNILVVATFALILFFIIFGIVKCSGKKNVNTQPVYDNKGMVYYANEEDGNRLYVGTVYDEGIINPQKLSDAVPSELLLDGQWLYYTNANRGNMIYRVSTRGLDESLVYDIGAKNLEIIYGWLVFDNKSSDYAPYKIKLSEVETGEVAVAVPDDGVYEYAVSTPSESSSESTESSEPSESSEGSDTEPGTSSDKTSDAANINSPAKNMKVNNNKLPWSLILANSDNELSTKFDAQVETATLQNGKKVDKRIKTKLNEMLFDMKNSLSDCNIYVSSSYRSVATQQALFERKVESFESDGMSQAEAEKEAVKTVFKAGASDHNTGLAVDFNDSSISFAETKEYEWLKENSYKYGFIERYSKDCEDKTGANWEPYHYRYVGSEAAKIIHNENITLEEYIFKYYASCIIQPEE